MKKVLFALTGILFLISTAAPSLALCVKAEKANLRGGMGTSYEKTWEVYMYMPFRKLIRKGNWYKVKDVDGDIHWIYRRLVTDRFKCAVVRKKEANIRSGPGTRYEKILYSPAPKYTAFKVLKTSGQWVNVEDDFENTGWIHKNLLWIQ